MWGRLVGVAAGRDVAGVATGALAVAATVTTFLGWGRSGERSRSGYELVDAAARAGVLPDGWAWSASVLYLVPAACGLLLVALAARRAPVAGVVATTIGALVGTAAVLVIRSPLVAEPAAWAALVLGAGTTLGGVAVLATGRKETVG